MGHHSPASAVENYSHLRERFADRLLAQHPASVLDVGCGDGALMLRCQAAGVPAIGIEATSGALAELRARGLEVLHGIAEALPLADGACDWVTLRHVPHHLTDPAAAVADALRVCRTGVLVAEPWFDPRVPSQRTALEADRWLKRQHRRQGMVHEEALDTEALLATLPAYPTLDVEVDIALRLRSRAAQDLVDEAAPLLAALPIGDADHAAFAELMATIERDGLSWNGTLIVAVRQRPND